MNNKAYRVIWNEELNSYVAVPEFTRARGKRSSATVLASAGSLAALLLNAAAAQVQVSSGNTQVYSGLNGVTVVDIATANAKGLSHNKYNQFNVDQRGMVLNNSVHTNPIQSQLAGQVERNLNLNAAAKLILNEVVAQNRSTLRGYMEVAGARADVVVANPWGITCGGCGFINTDRATLTTGTPNIASDGSLLGFRINQGDIRIGGTGLNASNVNVLDIVARSVVLDGQINAQDLKLIAGRNEYSYANRIAHPLQPGDVSAVAYAIDSTILGGAYANKIDIVATEQGVGVRMLGDAATSAQNFTLSAAGKIELQSRISAAQDISISTTAAGTDALHLRNAQLNAAQALNLKAQAGELRLTEGSLHAGRDLQIHAQSMRDQASAEAQRFAEQQQTWNITQHAALNGGHIGAGSHIDLTVGSLAVGPQGVQIYSGSDSKASDRSVQLTATAGDLQLGTARLIAPGAINITSLNGAVSLADTGRIQANDHLQIQAATSIANSGQIEGNAAIHLTATDDHAQLINQGILQSQGQLKLGDETHVLSLNNSGQLLTADSLHITGEQLTNTGTVQALTSTHIQADSLHNQGRAAAWLLSTQQGPASSLQLRDALDNQGTLQSANAIDIHAEGSLTNSGNLLIANNEAHALSLTSKTLNNSGHISTAGPLTLHATSAAGTAIRNSGQIHNSGTGLVIHTQGGAIDNTASGKIFADQTLQVTTAAAHAELTNAGIVQSLGLSLIHI